MSKYCTAITQLGGSASPDQIRRFLNRVRHSQEPRVTTQNVASSLWNLKERGRVRQLDNGLYEVMADV